ncbi:M50 family metallopeptidase [Bacillota bacterium LX-D]|nr:M50 family metallopeptidase [Bacillota bacterium LX-D]
MKIAELWGVKIIINDFFLLLILAYGMLGVLPQVFIIFTLILIHEMAHIRVAVQAGIKVKEIELYPFGGVARVEGVLQSNPQLEMRVALAGPFMNFLLWTLGFIIHSNFHWQGSLYHCFMQANLTMGLFNLLPVLPLDGGRILRAYWAKKSGDLQKATWQVALWGKYCAAALIIGGLISFALHYTDLMAVITALFIFIASRKEEEASQYIFLRFLLRKNQEISSKGLLPLKCFSALDTLQIKEIITKFSPNMYHLVIVLDKKGNFKARITEHELLRAFFQLGGSCTLGKMIQG